MAVRLRECVCVLVVAALTCAVALASSGHDKLFEQFKRQYKRVYATVEEERYRYSVFVSNMERAEAYGAVNPLAEFGVNQFADKTHAELFPSGDLRKRRSPEAAAWSGKHGMKRELSDKEVRQASGMKIDWREKGAVTDVKNQENCGGCWAFASAAAAESQWFLAGNSLVSLSPQIFISCVTADYGCNGGLPSDAYDWAVESNEGRIATYESYPFVDAGGNTSPCDPTRDYTIGAVINGYYQLPSFEDQMGAFVYSGGPIAVAIDATSVQLYNSGIITQCISEQVDHAVTVIGLDDSYSTPYWIIKNSWGKTWGESGYFRVEKGSDQCLITTMPTVPYTYEQGLTLTQQTCMDSGCKNCKSVVIPQQQCRVVGNMSYRAACTESGVLVRRFVNSKCTGTSVDTTEPTNQCLLFNTQNQTLWSNNICPTTKKQLAVQTSCSDPQCSENCESEKFHLNECLASSSTTSDLITCNTTAMLVKHFTDAGDCSGSFKTISMVLNECYLSSDAFITNVCDTDTPN